MLFTFLFKSFDCFQERDEAEVKSGGRLLEGSYDEQESAASFQEALREWRNQPSNPPGQKNGLWVNPVGDPKSGKSHQIAFYCVLNKV